MASLLRRAIHPQFLPCRFVSSSAAASLPSHVENNKKMEEKQKSPDMPCPARKPMFSPSSIRTDSMNISKALDSAVQRLKQESEDQLMEEDGLSLEIIDGPGPTISLAIKAPNEIIQAEIHLDSREPHRFYQHVKICICREDEDVFEYEYDDDGLYGIEFNETWESWQNYFHFGEDVRCESDEVCELMIGRVKSYVERVLAKRGINKSMIQWLRDRDRRDKQLAWMGSVEDFLQN